MIDMEALAQWSREKAPIHGPPEEPSEPVAKRYMVDDTTIEAIAPILAGNPRGLLLSADELAAWFGSFDRYAGGKGGDAARWLTMFDEGDVKIDRKTGTPRTIFVPNASVCITGGIQPGILRKSLGSEHRESGMAARLLLTCPPRVPAVWTEDEISPADEAQYAEIINRLYDIQVYDSLDGVPQPHIVSLDADAKAAWTKCHDQLGAEQYGLLGDLAAAWSKLMGYVPRLALIFHWVRVVSDDATLTSQGTIDRESMSSAIRVVDWCKREAKRVYGMLSESDEDSEQRKLVEWIRRKGGSVTVRDVQRGLHAMQKPGGAEPALLSLVERGIGDWGEVTPGKSRQFTLTT